MKTSLPVLVPVHNEQHLVYAPLERLKLLETSPHLERVEVIAEEECSKDDTLETFPLRSTTAKISCESLLCLLD